MEIFYLRKENFLHSIDIESLKRFNDGRVYLSAGKYSEHLCGLFLAKFIAKHVYAASDTDVILQGNKPLFKSGGIYFSISHSNDIVLAAFNNAQIGVDVEYMKERNFQKIMTRYGYNVKNPSKEDFYKFWTAHEAEIKLGDKPKSLFSAVLEQDYFVSCLSSNIIVTNFIIKRLCIKEDAANIDLYDEFKRSSGSYSLRIRY